MRRPEEQDSRHPSRTQGAPRYPVISLRKADTRVPCSGQQESWRRTRKSSSGSTTTSESASLASPRTHAFSRQSGLTLLLYFF